MTPFLLRAICLLLLCGAAQAVEFREVRWGFNGATKRHEFNLCTVELINPGPEPFAGPVELRPIRSIYTEVPLIEPDVYIGPGESRTIQFLPFISSDTPEWEVSWGRGPKERQELPRPSRETSSPVAVQFLNPQAISSPIKGIEAFSELDFPIGGPGAEVLGTVILDHVPRWDELRRRAFRDWLGQGGELYLLNDRDGKHLEFPAPLEELNVAADRFAIGQGVVIRHAPIQDLGEIAELVPRVSVPEADPNTGYANINYNDPRASGLSQLFQNMQGKVRPNHNWPLIFFLAVIYLLVLFPGIWIFSRKRGDFRVTYAAILATVALFSLLYAEIGKRGYDESTGMQEMIVAQPLGNQRLLVHSYSNLFVTEGGEYPITPRGEGAVVSLDAGGQEAARFSGSATIFGRPKAGLVADIPPFSSCSFQTHSIVPIQSDYSLVVDKFEVQGATLQIEGRAGSSIPADAKLYFLTDTNNVIELTREGNTCKGSGSSNLVNTVFPATAHYGWSRPTPTEIEQNLRANLVQVATRIQIQNQHNYGYQAPVTPNTPTVVPTNGYLVAIAAAPTELLSDQYGSTGTVLFLSRAQPNSPPAADPATTP